MKLSRRTTLAVLGGSAIFIGSGIAFVATMSDEELVHAVLERHLEGLEMAKEDLSAFLADFRETRPWLFPSTKLAVFYGAAERLNISDTTRKSLLGDRSLNIERFERYLLGDFYIKTDVAFRSSPNDPVHYLGSSACLNPFAEFV